MAKDTRKNIAHNYLREAILTWKIPPGNPIVEQEISDQLGISRTPVREALKLLEAEGLVKVVPQRGTFVSELTTQDIEEIFTLRESLEVLALEVAIHNIPVQDLNEIEQHLGLLTSQSPPEQFFECDRLLHGLIVKHGGNERLAHFLESLNAQVERVRRISSVRPNRLEMSVREHLAIVRAIQARDWITAEAELRQHTRNVKQSTLDVCRNMWWHNI